MQQTVDNAQYELEIIAWNYVSGLTYGYVQSKENQITESWLLYMHIIQIHKATAMLAT